MNTQPRTFLVSFAATAAVVFAFAQSQRPGWAVASGMVGLLVHWRLSSVRADPPSLRDIRMTGSLRDIRMTGSGQDGDAELADSSYFLGFLLTLVLLAAGLWSLASTGASTGGRAASVVLYQFLYDLAAGLTLTIAGLAIRQVRTLSAPSERDAATTANPGHVSPGLELVLRDLIQALDRRPDEALRREVDEARSRARRATDELERGIADVSPRIITSMTRLEESVTSTSASLTRTASALGDSLTQTTERIDSQVGDVLKLLERERAAMSTQLEQWCTMVMHAHQLIATGHQALDTEYRRGVAAVSAAGTSFTSLSSRVVQEIERLPNPAERLQSLWTGVESLDQRLRSSIGDAGTQLAAIGSQAQTTAASIERLSQSVRAAADRIERGGGEIGATLERELRDLSKVLDDFYGLLDERVKTIGAR